MHVVSRRLQAGLAITAACLLTPACAADRAILGDDLVYAPAPASTLLSRRDLQFRLAHVQRGASRTTILAHQAPGAEPAPVAAISSTPSEPVTRVSVRLLLSAEGEGDPAGLIVATFEYLYALALRQEPAARFCLAHGMQRCEFANDGQSHAEFLRELTVARQRAIARASHAGASVPWQVVSMSPAAVDADQVGVRVTSDQVPMEGATVFFNRAPHSGCVAKSRENGLAACVLVDQHGDDESHSEHDKTPVVATFPGDVRAGRVLVPTTLVLAPLS